MFQNAWLSYLIISDNNISFLKSVSNCDLELSNRCGVFSVKLKEIVFVIVVRESNFEIALLKWYYDQKNEFSVIFTFRKYKHSLLTVPILKFKLQWEMPLF